MNAYRAKVPTTNATRDRFKIGDDYFPCVDGEVIIIARDIAGAAKQVPTAIAITCEGAAHVPEKQEG